MPQPLRSIDDLGCSTRRRGFSITEMLVAISVITVLAALLLPAMSGIKLATTKSAELARARHLGTAWTMYAVQNKDSILPGYLPSKVQEASKVKYYYPDGSEILPWPEYEKEDKTGWPNVAGPWPWRLMPFLDDDPSVVIAHRDSEADVFSIKDRAWEIAREPAFGYNGLFIGGWWGDAHSPIFSHAKEVSTGDRFNVVSRTLASIRRPAQVIAFTPSALREPGVYKYDPALDDEDGSFIVLPPLFWDRPIWFVPRDVKKVSADSIQVGGNASWFDETAPFG